MKKCSRCPNTTCNENSWLCTACAKLNAEAVEEKRLEKLRLQQVKRALEKPDRACRDCKRKFRPGFREQFCPRCVKARDEKRKEKRVKDDLRWQAKCAVEKVTAPVVYVPRLNGIRSIERGGGTVGAFLKTVKED